MKGFKVYKNFITDKECQQIIDSLNKQESDYLQNRYEIQDYDIPQSVLDKSKYCPAISNIDRQKSLYK